MNRINLLDQKEPTLNFNNESKNRIEFSDTKVLYYKKVIKLTDKEKQNHSKYLKTELKKNFF